MLPVTSFKVQVSTAALLSGELTSIPHEVEGLDPVTLGDLSVLGIPAWNDVGFWPVELDPATPAYDPSTQTLDGWAFNVDAVARVIRKQQAVRALTSAELQAKAVEKALLELQKTDATMRRIFEAVFAGRVQSSDVAVQSWFNFSAALRQVVSSGGTATYPVKPDYVANT